MSPPSQLSIFPWAATSRRDMAECQSRYLPYGTRAAHGISRRHGEDQDEICGHSVSTLSRQFGMKSNHYGSTSVPNSLAVPCTCLAYAESGAPGFCRTHIIVAKRTRPDCHKLRRESHRFDARMLLLSHRAQAPGHDDYDCNHIHPPLNSHLGASLPIPNSGREKAQPAHSRSRTTCIRPTRGSDTASNQPLRPPSFSGPGPICTCMHDCDGRAATMR